MKICILWKWNQFTDNTYDYFLCVDFTEFLPFTGIHSVEISEFSPTTKILRQIDLQYNSLVEFLNWRNFWKKIVGKNLQISTLCRNVTSFWRKNYKNLPFFSSSRFLAASSRCFRIIANLARSARASSVFPAAWSFW